MIKTVKINGNVVSGFLRKDDKFLVGLRPENKPSPGLLEFIGGKVDPTDASPEAALIREYKEEGDLHVQIIGKKVFEEVLNFPDGNWNVLMYEVGIISGSPTCKAHQWLKWLTWEEMQDYIMSNSLKEVMFEYLSYRMPDCNPKPIIAMQDYMPRPSWENDYVHRNPPPPRYGPSKLEVEVQQKFNRKKYKQAKHKLRVKVS